MSASLSTRLGSGIPAVVVLFFWGCSSSPVVEESGEEAPGWEILPSPEGEPRAYFDVIGEDGKPLRPDRAWWTYPGDGSGGGPRYEALCVDDACTRFEVRGAVGAVVYVAASRARPAGSHCDYLAYDAHKVDLEAGPGTEVTLRLKEGMACE